MSAFGRKKPLRDIPGGACRQLRITPRYVAFSRLLSASLSCHGRGRHFVTHLYYGDNLDILRRYVADDSVDLVYLDPPFNSNQTYNVLFQEQDGARSASQIKAFEDTWHWD